MIGRPLLFQYQHLLLENFVAVCIAETTLIYRTVLATEDISQYVLLHLSCYFHLDQSAFSILLQMVGAEQVSRPLEVFFKGTNEGFFVISAIS